MERVALAAGMNLGKGYLAVVQPDLVAIGLATCRNDSQGILSALVVTKLNHMVGSGSGWAGGDRCAPVDGTA